MTILPTAGLPELLSEQRLGDSSIAFDDRHFVFREHIAEDAFQARARVRRHFARLQDHAVTRRDRRDHRPETQVEREVPRRNDEYDTLRLVDDPRRRAEERERRLDALRPDPLVKMRRCVPRLADHRKNLRQVHFSGRLVKVREHRFADFVAPREHRLLQPLDFAATLIRARRRDAMPVQPLTFEDAVDVDERCAGVELRSRKTGHRAILSRQGNVTSAMSLKWMYTGPAVR
jgi:hypothetical protein